jgi:hypothetical protein
MITVHIICIIYQLRFERMGSAFNAMGFFFAVFKTAYNCILNQSQ